MTQQVSTTNNSKTPAVGVKALSSFLNSDGIKNKFTEILGQKGVGFISSVLSVVSSNQSLANADQNSIYTAALLAASLDLPINQNLGFAYIVPYNAKQSDGSFKQMAQFQLGYKGFKQLAQRTGQFKYINESDVRKGEIKNYDRLTGDITFEWIQDTTERLKQPIVGYVSYFELQNGFKSTFYMSVEEIEAHAKKYSQTYKKFGTGLWKDDKEGMSKKTVAKLNLSKNAPLSIEMQRAIVSDQAVIKSDSFLTEDTVDIDTQYVDNEEVYVDHVEVSEAKQRERAIKHIESSTSLEQLKQCASLISDDDLELYDMYKAKEKSFSKAK